jgi:tRNA pseudouridine38-40 synthase
VAFAGRTDAGVHAFGQVAAFETNAELAPAAFVSGINHYLPRDIAVRAAKEVEEALDVRRDARRRVYRYHIVTRPTRSAILRDRVWHVGQALNIDVMRGAAQRLEGQHDFAAFAGQYEGSTERTLERCEVSMACNVVTVTMAARSFLPHQVRRTVGPLVEVGAGKMREATLLGWLDGGSPASAGPAAPGCGLYLERVEYDELAFNPDEAHGCGL